MWEANQSDILRQIKQQEGLIYKLIEQKDGLVAALASNPELAGDIKDSIARKKEEIKKDQQRVNEIKNVESEFVEFTEFAMDFIQKKLASGGI